MASTDDVRQAAEDGMRRAEEHAPEEWRHAAYKAVVATARTRPYFTSVAIWDALEEWQPETPSALGGVMRQAQIDGFIAPDGMEKNTRKRAHRTYLTRWRSLVYEGAGA